MSVLTSLFGFAAGVLIGSTGVGAGSLGHVDWPLVFALLLGSVPGIWLGAQLARFLPERLARVLLSATLLLAGVKVI